MRNVAQKAFKQLIKDNPVLHRVMNRRLDQSEVLVSPRFFRFSNIVLQTKNISSIQKFERRDDALIDDAARSKTNNYFLLAAFLFAAGLAGLFVEQFGPVLFVFGIGSAIASAWFAYEFRKIFRANEHNKSDFYIEVYMNSGRRHRFYSSSESTADNIEKMFLVLMYSDDQGEVYKLDQSTNTFVLDQTDRSISNIQIGDDISFEIDTEEGDVDDDKEPSKR